MPKMRMKSLKSRAMNCGPLSEMIRGVASAYFSLARCRITSTSASRMDSRRSQPVKTLLTHQTDAQCLGTIPLVFFENRKRLVAEGKNFPCVFIEPLPSGRKAAVPADRTVDEWNSDLSFELADAQTDSGLRAKDPFRSTQKTLFFGDRDQHFELHKFHLGLSWVAHKQRGRHRGGGWRPRVLLKIFVCRLLVITN